MDVTIKGSVGADGKNGKADTRKIQKLLNAIFPSTLLSVDGDCGSKSIRRIKRFQKRFMAKPDGRVDPGGRTLKKLNAAAPGMQKDWSGDSSRWSEEKKLSSLDKRMRPKVVRVLDALKAEEFKPKIFFAWRSVAVQQEIFAKGNSKVRFSFHNAQKKNGTPNAYAVDIIDKRWAWGDKAEENGFWQALGKAGKAEGLFWGGDWRSFKDWAHLQFFPNNKLSDVKKESLRA
jgi:peptidoglycan L-alanyl-D-glutamate endopeptidase CwlK